MQASKAIERARDNCEAASRAVAAAQAIRAETQARRLQMLESFYRIDTQHMHRLGRWYLAFLGGHELEEKEKARHQAWTTNAGRR